MVILNLNKDNCAYLPTPLLNLMDKSIYCLCYYIKTHAGIKVPTHNHTHTQFFYLKQKYKTPVLLKILNFFSYLIYSPFLGTFQDICMSILSSKP